MEKLILKIEAVAGTSLKEILQTGVIFKDEKNFYKVDNSFLNSHKKLNKLLKDLKYKNFCYIPF
jgi:hypothetical protein